MVGNLEKKNIDINNIINKAQPARADLCFFTNS